MSTEDILQEREKTHGDFEAFAKLRVELAKTVGLSKSCKLNDVQSIAMSMILTKIARIVCGDPNHADHWDDIAGYAMLGRGKKELDFSSINFASEPCGHNNKKRQYYTDTAKEVKNITAVNHCLECGRVDIVDSWQENATRSKEDCQVKEEFNCIDSTHLLNKLKTWLEMLLGPKRALKKDEHEYYSKKIAYCFRIYAEAAFERWRKTGRPENSTSSKMEHVGEEALNATETCDKLMRENYELKKAIEATHKTMIENIERIIRLEDENRRLIETRWAEADKAYKEGEGAAISQMERTDDRWYDAEKCLPLLNRAVTIQYKIKDGTEERMGVQLQEYRGQYWWHATSYSDEYGFDDTLTPTDEYNVIKWRYDDEN